jgi:mRNA interferase RelE/StbE
MYQFEFHPEAKKELVALNHSLQILFTKKLKQILHSPELGVSLGNKNNLNLTRFKKVYFNNKRHRIVYEILEDRVLIYIIAIGKRADMEVYKKAHHRMETK